VTAHDAIDDPGTTLALSDEISAAFGEVRVVAITAESVDNRTGWPQVATRIDELEQAVAAGRWRTPGEDDARIAAWHQAYRWFGTNPRRQRPSVDALTRRLARTGRLPRINPLVDCYNLVSATHVVPAGAFDLDRVDGGIVIRYARPDDAFTPLGEPGNCEAPHAGEVVYADTRSVLTRHWNHRDADGSKVTEASRRVVIVLESIDATHHAGLDAAAADLAALLTPHSGSVTAHVLDATRSRADLTARPAG
jgi:DNA/RNA-binding domain of Phe-tRNA-synthetase-like protein